MVNSDLRSSRNSFLDITKGVAILLVILGHSIQYGMGEGYEGYWENPLFRFIYSFHMPLFMLISGYLFWHSYQKRGGKVVVANRFKTLLYPIFFYEIALCLIYRFDYTISLGIISSWSLWFFWAILNATVVGVLMFFARKRFNVPEPLFIAIVFFALMCFPDTRMLSANKFVLTYFLVGGVVCKYSPANKSKYAGWFSLPFLLLLYFFHKESYIYTSGYTIIGEAPLRHLLTNIFRFILGLTGSITVLWLIYLFKSCVRHFPRLHCSLAWLGRQTLLIYFFQSFFFTVFPALHLPFYGIWQPALVFVIVTGSSVLFIFTIHKYKYLSLLFLGKVYK